MCGRAACTLCKRGVQRATCQYSKNGQEIQWIDKYQWQSYKPNYNLSPSQQSPVLVNHNIYEISTSDNYVLTSMRWGLIPSWFKGGTIEECSLKTNNCRIEGLLDKPTFRGPGNAGRRCVVLADGFYEWKEINSKRKQPYFIYFPQKYGVDVFNKSEDSVIETNEWKVPQLLTMAGIYDVWRNPDKENIFSYSVITIESSKSFSFVHHRMPAILTGKDEVSMWLDSNRVPTKDALTLLRPVENLQMHPVSNIVNFSKNNSVECLQPLKEEKKTIKTTGLTSWLLKKPGNDPQPKRRKTDDD